MKIFYIMACEECHHCIMTERFYGYQAYCIESEKEIPDIAEIAEFCELEDAQKELKEDK